MRMAHLIKLNALLRHTGLWVLHPENPQLGLHQVRGILLHGAHVKPEPSEVGILVGRRDDVCKTKRTVLITNKDKSYLCRAESFKTICTVFLCSWWGFSRAIRGCCQMNGLDRRAIWWTTQTVGEDLWIAPVVHISLVNQPRVTRRTFELVFECLT